MRAAQYSNLKTVKIDSNIFNQTFQPARSKLPLQFLKTIVERKRNNQISLNYRGDRFISSLSKTRQIAVKQQLRSEASIKNIHQTLITVELIQSKKNDKTNSQVENYSAFSFTDKNLKRFDLSFNKNSSKQQLLNIREVSQRAKSKFLKNTIKFNQENFQDHQYHQNIAKINPYTHQKYAYLAYRQRDQIQKIKKTTRFERISSMQISYYQLLNLIKFQLFSWLLRIINVDLLFNKHQLASQKCLYPLKDNLNKKNYKGKNLKYYLGN